VARRSLRNDAIRDAVNGEIEELAQMAWLGMLRAARRYDPARQSNASFATYAFHACWKSIVDEVDHGRRSFEVARGPSTPILAGRESS
jgi:DNA-directed RNA polymerase specialized sigma subunit